VAAYFRNHSKAKFHILAVKCSNRLTAVLPLIKKRKWLSHMPAKVLRGPSDFNLWPFDIPVATSERRNEIATVLWHCLGSLDGWDIIEIPNVPQGGTADELIRQAEQDGYRTYRWEYMQSPYILLPELNEKDNPLRMVCSPNLRANIRKALRRIDNHDGGLKVRYTDNLDREAIRRLYELEACGWKGKEGKTMTSSAEDEEFWSQIADMADQYNLMSLTSLELKNQVVAVSLGLKYHQKFFGLKMGWDERYRSYSLGHLLVYFCIENCLQQEIREFHLMGLRSDWKEKWTNKAHPHATCYIFRGRIYGAFLKYSKMRSILNMRASWNSQRGILETGHWE
jgi:hypothetical protein